MKKILYIIFGLFIGFTSHAQTLNVIKGKVLNSNATKPITDCTIAVQGTDISQKSAVDGTFTLNNVPKGDQIIVFKKAGLETQYFPLSVNNSMTDLGEIIMFIDVDQTLDDSVISLSDDDLSDDEAGGADNVAGILQSSKDTYQRAIAFNFGQVWFKERGYDSSFGQVSFNGMPMNKVSNGRPQWSDWGGLNDVLRNQVFTNGLAASESTFGGVLGTTDFNTRASNYREGGKVSYAFTNSNYDGRAMASYSTGLMENGWALTVLGSRRFAQEGYTDGTSYNAWGGFIAVEKKLNDKHGINFTAFYTPNRRGKNSPNTQEAYDLGGLKYNAYWGYQGDRKRNARMKEIKEPTFMLGHYWNVNDKTTVNTNILYQLGTIGNSRLGYQGVNPDPTYFQNMPSYWVIPGRENFQTALEKTQMFLNNEKGSHLIWDDFYTANNANDSAAFYQYEDVNEDKTLAINSIINTQVNDHIIVNGSVLYKKIASTNYARMMDLLGASHHLDVDKYATPGTMEEQNDLNNPNRKIGVGDHFSYDYTINANILDAFAQAQFKYEKLDFYVAGNFGMTSYQREGNYKNGKFANTSYGLGEKKQFPIYGTKLGLTYKLSGRHLLNINTGYMTKAPSLRNAYANSRVYEGFVKDVTTAKILSADASYIYRASGIKARLTGYYTTFKDLSKVSFYYVDGVAGLEDTSDFLTTNLTHQNLKNIGGELGIEAQITPTISVTGVAALGQFTYDNNPDFQILTDENIVAGEDQSIRDFGTAYLKNYKQSGTPQRGYSLGFSYRDPNYWWVSTNANLLSNNYISLSEFRRNDNFYKDPTGNAIPLNDVTQEDIDNILVQEKFDTIFLVNLVGGKSWKVKSKYFGVFASINNLLGEDFKTGGFEQARKANFNTLSEDQNLETPLFGNKYWYGRNTSYYLNFYIRF